MTRFAEPLGLALLLASDAAASERGDWFSSLKMPSGGSCCDVADCRATSAEWRGGQWWALVEGMLVPIPPERVLRHPHSIDGDAYVCNAPAPMLLNGGAPGAPTIYCFVPPDTGS